MQTTRNVPPKPATTATLEAPEQPARPMTRSPKQRHDVREVARMLREGREQDATAAALQDADGAEEGEEEGTEGCASGDAQGVAPAPEETDALAPEANEFGAPDWFRMPPNGLPPDVKPGTTV